MGHAYGPQWASWSWGHLLYLREPRKQFHKPTTELPTKGSKNDPICWPAKRQISLTSRVTILTPYVLILPRSRGEIHTFFA